MGSRFAEHHRQAAALAGRLSGDVEKHGRMRDRIENDTNAGGNVSDIAAFSPGASSMASSAILSTVLSRSSGSSTPEPQKIWRMYSGRESVSGSWAAIRRIFGLTVKVTSTSSSSVGE